MATLFLCLLGICASVLSVPLPGLDISAFSFEPKASANIKQARTTAVSSDAFASWARLAKDVVEIQKEFSSLTTKLKVLEGDLQAAKDQSNQI